MATKKETPQSFARRDQLRDIEKAVQQKWEESKVFESNAPEDPNAPKFMGTFPYPYMNGRLHLGHSFSLSKLEFAAAFKRMDGYNVLFPFGFHCTGMPISACADKLKVEIAQFGNPPNFPEANQDTASEESTTSTASSATGNSTSSQDKPKEKAKILAKSGGEKRQWNILKSVGVPEEEIHKFSDPVHWLQYFPPIAMDDLKAFGSHVDWRRSFITTDVNPYYDSFIRWHITRLRDSGKIKFGKRMTIFSPIDNQPCADHDRATGEGVQVQEYTGIKMKVLEFPKSLSSISKYNVYLVAATLRPETMYGQTNCWILPEGDYGAFEVNETDVFIISDQAARNFSYQYFSKEFGKVNKLLSIKGQDLLGLPLKAPLTNFERIYTLPLLTISMKKGTGVVTSVPSDAPDDYAALNDLRSKPAFREKFGIKDEWVLPFEPVPIIDIPEFGNLSAVKVCIDMKIKSQNDKENLAIAKEKVYLKGFYEGVLIVGEYAGSKVRDVKQKIKDEMIASGDAVPFFEPEKEVISRSGDVCVACLTDQWYITYGEEEWKKLTGDLLSRMDTYTEETRIQMHAALEWLNQWACSRTYGLGTRLPWDTTWLIESLSDSTIYMAYYTVAHLLQEGSLDGSVVGPAGISADQLTLPVWDYIFLDGEYPAGETTISEETLKKLRKEFNYWYPLDLRVSGKDLIQNHLIFWLYNHTAIFKQEKWPCGVRANGHLLLNSEKMSKSTGNFLTLRESVEKYSADAMRITLADAGDGMEDANFLDDTANKAILRLTTQLVWIKETLADQGLRTGPLNFADEMFINVMNYLVKESKHQYSRMMFREALKLGFYDLQAARDNYRSYVSHIGMHKDVIYKFIEIQTLVMAPITPHYCEYIWGLLGKDGFLVNQRYPEPSAPVNDALLRADKYLVDTLHTIRVRQQSLAQPKKGKGAEASVEKASTLRIYVGKSYPEWQQKVLTVLKENYNEESKEYKLTDKEFIAAFQKEEVLKPVFKKVMPFVAFTKEAVKVEGSSAFDLATPFDEVAVLTENAEFIKRSFGMNEVYIHTADDESAPDPQSKKSQALPGKPSFIFL
eukprot:TRINITY_DN1098_c0_g1_i1.p1 TRINITY_DN1098_c0_g1~~TRINITY_DN1098_c0_g1_i1.p1  ORF type:complete len:1073 (-),score=277.98 TRINITY_DN1098_c0_g1_i1:104-3322(-)